jgi:hypothetical protein
MAMNGNPALWKEAFGVGIPDDRIPGGGEPE